MTRMWRKYRMRCFLKTADVIFAGNWISQSQNPEESWKLWFDYLLYSISLFVGSKFILLLAKVFSDSNGDFFYLFIKVLESFRTSELWDQDSELFQTTFRVTTWQLTLTRLWTWIQTQFCRSVKCESSDDLVYVLTVGLDFILLYKFCQQSVQINRGNVKQQLCQQQRARILIMLYTYFSSSLERLRVICVFYAFRMLEMYFWPLGASQNGDDVTIRFVYFCFLINVHWYFAPACFIHVNVLGDNSICWNLSLEWIKFLEGWRK